MIILILRSFIFQTPIFRRIMFNIRLTSALLFFTLLIAGCSAEYSDHHSEGPVFDPDHHYIFAVNVVDRSGNPLQPAGVSLFDAAMGRESTPQASFHQDDGEIIESIIDKGAPVVVRISAAYHQPLYLFLPSFSGDRLTVQVRPEPFSIKENPWPHILGNFNHFDDFSSIPMQSGENGVWFAEIESQSDTLIYLIDGVADGLQIHGKSGEKRFNELHTPRQAGLESYLIRDHSEPFTIQFNPEEIRAQPMDPIIDFDNDTPVSIAGVAKTYAEMIRMEDVQSRSETEPDFSRYFQKLEKLQTEYNHPEVDLAAKLARVRFADHLETDPEWADNVLQQIHAGSDLWLMYYPAITKLFNKSTGMEVVSRNLWDLYRQQNHPSVQGEALYSLLKFHYQRGEDEEWYQAHFDLVREYPDHERINYSYNRGFAPDAVMHIDRYFPDFTYESLTDPGTHLSPLDPSAVLTIIYFWNIENLQSRNQIETLKSVYRSFSEAGTDIFLIALNSERERVQRFKDQNEIEWNTAAANFHDPNVQVLGVTEVPHTILLDRQNRVLINNEPFLNDERIYNLVEEYFNNLNWPE